MKANKLRGAVAVSALTGHHPIASQDPGHAIEGERQVPQEADVRSVRSAGSIRNTPPPEPQSLMPPDERLNDADARSVRSGGSIRNQNNLAPPQDVEARSVRSGGSIKNQSNLAPPQDAEARSVRSGGSIRNAPPPEPEARLNDAEARSVRSGGSIRSQSNLAPLQNADVQSVRSGGSMRSRGSRTPFADPASRQDGGLQNAVPPKGGVADLLDSDDVLVRGGAPLQSADLRSVRSEGSGDRAVAQMNAPNFGAQVAERPRASMSLREEAKESVRQRRESARLKASQPTDFQRSVRDDDSQASARVRGRDGDYDDGRENFPQRAEAVESRDRYEEGFATGPETHRSGSPGNISIDLEVSDHSVESLQRGRARQIGAQPPEERMDSEQARAMYSAAEARAAREEAAIKLGMSPQEAEAKLAASRNATEIEKNGWTTRARQEAATADEYAFAAARMEEARESEEFHKQAILRKNGLMAPKNWIALALQKEKEEGKPRYQPPRKKDPRNNTKTLVDPGAWDTLLKTPARPAPAIRSDPFLKNRPPPGAVEPEVQRMAPCAPSLNRPQPPATYDASTPREAWVMLTHEEARRCEDLIAQVGRLQEKKKRQLERITFVKAEVSNLQHLMALGASMNRCHDCDLGLMNVHRLLRGLGSSLNYSVLLREQDWKRPPHEQLRPGELGVKMLGVMAETIKSVADLDAEVAQLGRYLFQVIENLRRGMGIHGEDAQRV